MKVDCMCQCTDMSCMEMIREKAKVIDNINNDGQVLIVDSCLRGPSATDTLVDSGNGYSVYKEGALEGMLTKFFMNLLD